MWVSHLAWLSLIQAQHGSGTEPYTKSICTLFYKSWIPCMVEADIKLLETYFIAGSKK